MKKKKIGFWSRFKNETCAVWFVAKPRDCKLRDKTYLKTHLKELCLFLWEMTARWLVNRPKDEPVLIFVLCIPTLAILWQLKAVVRSFFIPSVRNKSIKKWHATLMNNLRYWPSSRVETRIFIQGTRRRQFRKTRMTFGRSALVSLALNSLPRLPW